MVYTIYYIHGFCLENRVLLDRNPGNQEVIQPKIVDGLRLVTCYINLLSYKTRWKCLIFQLKRCLLHINDIFTVYIALLLLKT